MNKICTDIEQSKKLVELGLDVNTADIMWFNDGLGEPMEIVCSYNPTTSDDVPAWSLSALLGLMPKLYEFENDPNDGGCQPNLCKGWDNNKWHIVYRSAIYITEWYDDPLDAAYEMVCWLLENKKI